MSPIGSGMIGRKDGEKMTNTEWIDVQTVDSKDQYIINIHSISMIHYESNLVFLIGRAEPLHITGQSMKELYETVVRYNWAVND